MWSKHSSQTYNQEVEFGEQYKHFRIYVRNVCVRSSFLVDFQRLFCAIWNADGELSDKLRTCKTDVVHRSDLLAEVVNKRILEEDCLERGWVLTGFPFTVSDFRHLDSLDTPPNR